tara:strand:+ start:714 stop:1028 length:315 start_codon:yes stop_codon:yes gene_type:complete
MFSKNLQNAIDAINTIDDTEEMHVLADYYNRRVNFLRKQKGKNIVIGDTIVWKFGGLEKFGKVYKVNPKTVYVFAVDKNNKMSHNNGYTTKTKVDKSLIIRKVA